MLKEPFGRFLLYNFYLTTLVYLAFLYFNTNYTVFQFILLVLAVISSVAILYIVIWLVSFIFRFHKSLFFCITTILFVILDTALVVDWFIYKIFGFHINGMVLNILTSKDALDSIQVSYVSISVFILLIIGFIFFEIMLTKFVQRKTTEETTNSKKFLLGLFIIILVEKLSFGFATLFSYNDFVSKFQVIPLYQPLTFNKIAVKYFGFDIKKGVKTSIQKSAKLKYPINPISINNSKKFHIFFILSDSFRYDMLNSQIAPNLTEFAKDSIVLKHHYSGGNSTRFGIFSLIYGLNSTYWFSFLNAQQKPILFDVLKKLDYDISIYSSTNTNWPEFRKTCYVDIQDSIHDNYKGKPWQKDRASSDDFIKNILTKKDDFRFSLLFLDSPHGYSFDPSFAKFKIDDKKVKYLKISPNSQELKESIKKYKNACYYNDKLFKDVIDAIKEQNLYDDSLIIFTADHGQEFYEYGYFGHNTSFSKAQVQVPMIIKLPKYMKDKISTNQDSLTSHQDIVASILSLLGVKNSPSDYTNGYDIFDKNFQRDYVYSANWNNNAIITPKYTVIFSNLPNKFFKNDIRDSSTYKELQGININNSLIMSVLKENKKFIK